MVISERKRTKTEAEFTKIPIENSPTFKNDANSKIQKAQNLDTYMTRVFSGILYDKIAQSNKERRLKLKSHT